MTREREGERERERDAETKRERARGRVPPDLPPERSAARRTVLLREKEAVVGEGFGSNSLFSNSLAVSRAVPDCGPRRNRSPPSPQPKPALRPFLLANVGTQRR